MKKLCLLVLLITTLIDIYLTRQAIKMQGVVEGVELNLLTKKLINNFGTEKTLLIIVPLYLIFCYFIIFYFWLPKFKYFYIALMIIKSLAVVLWLIYFILYATSGPLIKVA